MHCLFLKNADFHHNDDELKLINDLITKHLLNLTLSIIEIQDISNKTLKQLGEIYPNTPLLFFDKQSLILAMFIDNELIKTSLNWHTYQKRIVTAGKNNELILKACKLNKTMSVIDGTAGFGIDSLILASTGANITLIEQNPILFLMLVIEKQKMSQNKNWQKLMARIDILFGNSNELIKQLPKHNLIYLDPMFPNDSYKGLVNKNMQILHSFINPPNIDDEIELFNTAITTCDKLIIKRPFSAPNFANQPPSQSFNNAVIRFDVYMGDRSD